MIVVGGAAIAFGVLMAALASKNLIVMCIAIAIYGFCLLPIIGVGNSFAAMQQMPVSAAATSGLILIVASII